MKKFKQIPDVILLKIEKSHPHLSAMIANHRKGWCTGKPIADNVTNYSGGITGLEALALSKFTIGDYASQRE